MRFSLSGLSLPTSPFDSIRTRLTRGLTVHSKPQQLERGGELEATVTIDDPRKHADVEVGVVCTEAYAVQSLDNDGPDQAITWATAYEAWQRVEPTAGTHVVRLKVPTDGPFSYRGELLSFTWEVVARGVRKRRLDARATCRIEVLP